mmetsp:Transcript_82104/g.227695  ORF Transcript_82104/g.227695 Transcript_82104/m.227695 type:complete len:293 (+) Transcript_82104:224-1102(+)
MLGCQLMMTGAPVHLQRHNRCVPEVCPLPVWAPYKKVRISPGKELHPSSLHQHAPANRRGKHDREVSCQLGHPCGRRHGTPSATSNEAAGGSGAVLHTTSHRCCPCAQHCLSCVVTLVPGPNNQTEVQLMSTRPAGTQRYRLVRHLLSPVPCSRRPPAQSPRHQQQRGAAIPHQAGHATPQARNVKFQSPFSAPQWSHHPPRPSLSRRHWSRQECLCQAMWSMRNYRFPRNALAAPAHWTHVPPVAPLLCTVTMPADPVPLGGPPEVAALLRANPLSRIQISWWLEVSSCKR